MGASVYAAEPGRTIWPYHYHHGIEEWLYVISGEPVLRDPHGRRRLTPGDFVCFPSGPGGAHTIQGPGRFMLFSTVSGDQPYMSVYPDSGKVSGPEGMLLCSSAVEYWYGEGTWTAATSGPAATPDPEATPDPDATSDPAATPDPDATSDPAAIERDAEALPRPPVINVDALEAKLPEDLPAGFRAREARLGQPLGAELLGARLYELDPGEGGSPYHYECGREEWLLVLAGTPTLRHPDGEDTLEPGDIVCFVEGPAGAHRLVNRLGYRPDHDGVHPGRAVNRPLSGQRQGADP